MKIKVTLMYSDYTLEFEDAEVGFLEGNMVVTTESQNEIESTVFPLQSIAYYTIVEPKDDNKVVSLVEE